jgi:hypothetical protein
LIKMRNTGEFTIELTINGTQTITAGGAGTTETQIVPFAARLKAVFARLGVAGTGSTQTTDLLKNGVTMVSSGTLLSYATTSTTPTYSANLSPNPPTFNKGDVVTLKNTAVNTTPGVDQACILVFERARSGSWDDPVQFDTLGADSDAIC